MRCPACGFENASGIKFCGECGASLKLKCASCGFENAPGIKFCGECGKPLAAVPKSSPLDGHALAKTSERAPRSYTPKHLADKILTSRSALEGERKQVTVLFADVKGSMDLAEQVAPEEWQKIIDRFFAILSDGVRQHSCHHRMSTPRRSDAGVPQRPRPAPDAHASLLKLPPPQIIFCAATPAPGLRPLVW
jgi:hypothetical protein